MMKLTIVDPVERDETTAREVEFRFGLNAQARAEGETEPFDWVDFKDGPKFEQLIDADEIMLRHLQATAELTYPFYTAIHAELTASSPAGISRRDLVEQVYQIYCAIYAQEEASAKTKTVPLDARLDFTNRNTTDGDFGIWGYDLADLGISRAHIHTTEGGPVVTFFVES